MLKLTIHILPGELADRISILQLRIEHLSETSKRKEAVDELHELQKQWELIPPLKEEMREHLENLTRINARLWDIEDELRLHESRSDFGIAFIELARSVYQLNDQRSVLKRQINLNLSGTAGEEKVHLR